VGLLATAVAGVAAALGLSRRAPRPQVASGTVRTVEAYGPGRLQRGEWWLPPGEQAGTGRLPTVVLVHGGYWQPGYDRSLEDAVAADLAGRGFLVWNVDYAAADGGWPTTLLDVAAAHDHLVRGSLAGRVDPARTAVVGHSAGGHLALWLASRRRLPSTAPGAAPAAPAPALVVAQAPVASLVDGARERLGGGAVLDLLGGTPEQVPERYAVTDPVALAPAGVPAVLLHSRADALVPYAQSEAYARASQGTAELVEVPGDHFAHLDPRSPALEQLRRALARLRG
jgi:acetyl esterase/lipase